jgi:tetratricopeptide (TPR) repeat protein
MASFLTYCPPSRRLLAALACAALWLAACATGPDKGPAAPGAKAPAAVGSAAQARLERRAGDASRPAPARAAAWADLGVARAADGRWEEAAQAFESALGLVPDQAGVLFDLGVAYRHLGRYAEARDAYTKARTLAPDDLDIPYNLGILYELYLNEPDQALKAYAAYVAGGGPEAQKVRGWMEAIRQRGSGQGGTSP